MVVVWITLIVDVVVRTALRAIRILHRPRWSERWRRLLREGSTLLVLRRRRRPARWLAVVTTKKFAVLLCGVAALSDLAHLPRLSGLSAKVIDRASAWLEGGEFHLLLLRVHGRLPILRRVWVVWVLVLLVLKRWEGDDGAGGRVSDVIRHGAVGRVFEGWECKAVRV